MTALKAWFQRQVLARRWATFTVMGLAFLGFGAGTVNLFIVLKANVEFVGRHGLDALREGALAQLAEIVVTGYLSLAAFVIFKACEHALVHALCDPPSPPPPPAAPPPTPESSP